MLMRRPLPIIIGRDVTIRGPLGVAVKIDTGARLPRSTIAPLKPRV